jgi:3-phytase
MRLGHWIVWALASSMTLAAGRGSARVAAPDDGSAAARSPRDSPAAAPIIEIRPRGETGAVQGDADDCAIWVHPTDPARSLVIGTDKAASPGPGLHVWDLGGRELQFVPVPRPNNVDVRGGVRLGGRSAALVVCNARSTRELRVFRIDPESGRLEDVATSGGIPTPELADPYGLCLYRRPSDGTLFAIESTQEGDIDRLHQWRLEDDGSGRVRGVHVRAFGAGTVASVVEGLVADDELGHVYAAEEGKAVHKFRADPDSSGEALASFARDDGIEGDREGLAIWDGGGGRGWILLSSQQDGSVKVYRREGEPGAPHAHPLVATLAARGSRRTDGLDVTSAALPGFPVGMLSKHDSGGRRFVFYSWADAARGALGRTGGGHAREP